MTVGTRESKQERLHVSISGPELKQLTELNGEMVSLESEGDSQSLSSIVIDFLVR